MYNYACGEEVEDSVWFLKGGTLTALWISIVSCVDVYCMHKQECGLWNEVIMKGNRKSVVLINVHIIVDAESSGVNSGKVQCEREIGRVKSTRQIRNK